MRLWTLTCICPELQRYKRFRAFNYVRKRELLLKAECVFHWMQELLLAVIPRNFWPPHWSPLYKFRWVCLHNRLRNDGLASFHLSKWDANLSVFRLMHRNIITRHSGCLSCNPSREHCGLVNDVTHIPAPDTQSKITQEFTTIMFYQCRGYAERKKKRICAFTSGASTQYQIEHNAASRTPLPLLTKNLSPLCLHPPKLVWRVAQIPALKSECKTPVSFLSYMLSLRQQPLKLSFFS